MFDLLNREVKKFMIRNNRHCKIVMGTKTHETLGKLCSINGNSYLPFSDLEKIGYISEYNGTKIKQGNFEYGYYLI